MGRFCCINLKENSLKINDKYYNKLAKEIIDYALKNNIAAFFNSFDYWEDIISKADMKDFFLISDSFLYKSCELLDNTEFIKLIEENDDINVYKNAFINKYSFFKDLVDIIFKYNVSLIEIYISEDDMTEFEDFKSINSTKDTILLDLFQCVMNNIDKFGNEFPDLKISIKKS